MPNLRGASPVGRGGRRSSYAARTFSSDNSRRSHPVRDGVAPVSTSTSRDAGRAIWSGCCDVTHPRGKFHHVQGKGSITTWGGVESRSGAGFVRKGERLP